MGPTLVDASAFENAVTLTFSRELDPTSVPSRRSFGLTRGSRDNLLSISGAPIIEGPVVTLSLLESVSTTDTNILLSYTKPALNPLRSLANFEVESFTDHPVEIERPVQVTVSFGSSSLRVNEGSSR